MSDDNAQRVLGDLRDQFLPYYAPTDADRAVVMTTGMVVLDTNVLLDLYRYTSTAREELLGALRLLKSRLFVPHRVAAEYHAGRVGAVIDHVREQADTASRLTTAQTEAVNALNFLRNRRSLASEALRDVQDSLVAAFTSAIARVQALAQDYDLDPDVLTHHDPIRDSLEELLRGSVGRPLDPAIEKTLLAEFARNDKQSVLPGDADKGRKSMSLAVGDYLLWTQIKDEAKIRGLPVLLVSNDDKKDWVRKERGQTERPRRELVEEMLAHANVGLQMVATSRFLGLAREHLHAPVSAETLDQASRVRDADTDWPPIRVLADVDCRRIVLAKCCTPIPEDTLFASFRRGQQLRVHRTECAYAKVLETDETRPAVPVSWALEDVADYDFSIGCDIEATAEADLLAQLPTIVQALGARVSAMNLVTSRFDGSISGTALLVVPGDRITAVDDLLKEMSALPTVNLVQRKLQAE